MKDDHAGILREFARSAGAEPGVEHYREVAEAVASVRKMVGEMSGLKNLTLMAVLENTSAEFVPFLEKLATKLGSTNLRYTQLHGEADVKHADQFAWALEHDAKQYPDAGQAIDDAVNVTMSFLKNVLTN